MHHVMGNEACVVLDGGRYLRFSLLGEISKQMEGFLTREQNIQLSEVIQTVSEDAYESMWNDLKTGMEEGELNTLGHAKIRRLISEALNSGWTLEGDMRSLTPPKNHPCLNFAVKWFSFNYDGLPMRYPHWLERALVISKQLEAMG